MYSDLRGHTITSDSNEAGVALSRTIEAFASRQADTGAHLQAAVQADPSCSLAQATLGLMLHGARTVAFNEQANDALVAARNHSATVTAREKGYVDALAHSLAGRLAQAVQCYEAILDTHPTDLLALVFLQSELLWLGDMVWSERVSAKLRQHWTAETPNYAAFLAIRAFDLEENHRYADAERVCTEALALNPGDVWGAHAFAHVMLMQNRIDEGIRWMGERESLWDSATQMQYHLAWHQCLFLGERREYDRMLNIYDTRLRNREHPLCAAIPDLYIDLQNASSLLWRLERLGVDVGDRWQELSDVCTPRIEDMSNPFTSAHFALVLAANEQFDDCDKLLNAMNEFSENQQHDLAIGYRRAALPAAKAAVAHRKGQHDKVVALLKPAQEHLWQMGGSHAQQDMYFQLLADSTAKTGDDAEYQQLMHAIEQLGFVEPSRRVGYTL